MKIAIVNPPFVMNGKVGMRAGSRWPFLGNSGFSYFYCPYPMHMGYTASYLKEKGYDVLFYDAIGRRHNIDEFIHNLEAYAPDYVIQEISYPSINLDLEIARRMSLFTKVALAGTHASVAANELIKHDHVYAVFEGVYEEHALRLVETGAAGVYERYPLVNLDKYPWPVREDWMKNDSRGRFSEYTGAYTAYYDPCCGSMPEPMFFTTMSRGCPFKCNFCVWPNTLYDNKVAWRDVDDVLAEIDYGVSLGYKSVYFDDDTQNACGWGRMEKLCEGMKERNLPWLMLGRLDLNTTEQFQYMIDHGCAGMRLGVESLSQSQLDKMNKGLQVEDIIAKIEYLKEKTNLYLLFMKDFPGETDQDRANTLRHIEQFGARSQCPSCAPFPGTPYYEEIAEKFPRIRDLDPVEFDGNNLGPNLMEIIKEHGKD